METKIDNRCEYSIADLWDEAEDNENRRRYNAFNRSKGVSTLRKRLKRDEMLGPTDEIKKYNEATSRGCGVQKVG